MLRFSKILFPFIAVVLAACNSPSETKPSGTSAKASKSNAHTDPFYAPLNGVPLSQYENEGGGLLKVTEKNDFDLLLTSPGTTTVVDTRGMVSLGLERGTLYKQRFEGYLWRWHKRSDPMPYLGRLTIQQKSGRKTVITGSFWARFYEGKVFGSSPANLGTLREGFVEKYDRKGRLVSREYHVYRYSWRYSSLMKRSNASSYKYYTQRRLPFIEKETGQKPYYGSMLPQYEFVLPKPQVLVKAFPDDPKRSSYIREESLAKALKAKQIYPRHLLITPPKPAYLGRYDLSGRTTKRDPNRKYYSWESPFVRDLITETTYLQSYNRNTPVLTLPSYQKMVATIQQPENAVCMGKTRGVAVLTGRCDAKAPVFPLTVLTQMPNDQFLINVWTDANKRSTYLLSGTRDLERGYYKWSVDAFMIEKPFSTKETMQALSTGKDSTSVQLAGFAETKQDQLACRKMVQAVQSAENALQGSMRLEEKLDSYERNVDIWDNMGWAVENIKSDYSPSALFKSTVWDDSVQFEKDFKQTVQRFTQNKNVNNSVCQADKARMEELTAALNARSKQISNTLDRLNDTYYAQAQKKTREIYTWRGRLKEAKQQMAMNQLITKMNQSFAKDEAYRRKERAEMDLAVQRSKDSVKAQIAEVQARNKAYFDNQKPVYTQSIPVVVPVKLPNRSLDTTTVAKAPQPESNSRLSTKEAIEQAKAKTESLNQPVDVAQAGKNGAGADKAPEASGAASESSVRRGDGGAAMCAVANRNSTNTPSDEAYYYHYGRTISPLQADKDVRKKLPDHYSEVPSCWRNKEGQVGAMVVVVYGGEDSKGTPYQRYGMGFGQSVDAAEVDAVKNLKMRDWNWTTAKGYQVVFSKKY